MSHPQRQWNEEEVTRQLDAVRGIEAPEPPADLLARIQGEIPGDLFPPEQEVWIAPRRFPHQRRWFAAAAVAALAVTGGWLALRTMETAQSPVESLSTERPPAEPREEVVGQAGRGTPSAPVVSESSVADSPVAPGEAASAGKVDQEEAPAPQVPAPVASYRLSRRVPIPDPSPGEPEAVSELNDMDVVFALPEVQEARRPDSGPGDQHGTLVGGNRDGVAAEYSQNADTERFSGNEEYSDLRRERVEIEKKLKELEGQASASRNSVRAKDEVPQPKRVNAPPPARTQESLAEEPMRQLSPVESMPVPPPPAPPSTGGTAEPNDQPYGDVFFEGAGTNPFIDTEDDRLSTFGFDVDTGAYTVIRRYLSDGHLPPHDAVRVEEMINYFDYGDRPPRRGDFALYAEGAPSPFAHGERYHLLRFAVQGREVSAAARKPALLTFVVDVSGSMGREDRLGLVKQSLGLLLSQLRRDDQVALVVFGSHGRVLLPPTSDKVAIRQAIDRLQPEGATNAEEGLVLGYEIASRNAERGILNRVILCSDGVANVGNTGPDSILRRIQRGTEQGIELTTLGFGMGNYNDTLMEQLADQGDGRYAYIDTLDEAHRILVEELTGTLQTIASEARAQVDFNPRVVERYRLIGYENRDIADERFRDDTVDAGEIGAGHNVTALYEVKLAQGYEPGDGRQEVATLHVRYRSHQTERFEEVRRSVTLGDFASRWERASAALRLTSLVAEFGEILKGSYWAREGDLDEVFRRTQSLSAEFSGDRDVADLVSLMGRAASLAPR